MQMRHQNILINPKVGWGIRHSAALATTFECVWLTLLSLLNSIPLLCNRDFIEFWHLIFPAFFSENVQEKFWLMGMITFEVDVSGCTNVFIVHMKKIFIKYEPTDKLMDK